MNNEIIILAVANELQDQIKGDYICLLTKDKEQKRYVESTLFDLHSILGDVITDWPYVEKSLKPNGIWLQG